MKHASDIFPQALAELIAIGEKARKQREQRKRDTRNGGRAISMKQNEKITHTPYENIRIQ